MYQASENHTKLLRVLEKFRSFSIEQEYETPRVVVCGAQSVGKSSVLRAITGIPFPEGSGTCTRFVTRVIMEQRSDLAENEVSLKFETAPRAKSKKPNWLQGWHQESVKGPYALRSNLEKLLNNAKELVLEHHQHDLLMDCELHVTARGPQLIPLQLFDLPGMVGLESSVNGTMREDARRILDVYIKEQHTMILPIVKASDDFVSPNNSIPNACWDVDPEGLRTIGVLTHPDKCNTTNDKELREQWIEKLSTGNKQGQPQQNDWHVLYSRPSKGSDSRTGVVYDFFDLDNSQSSWSAVPTSDRSARGGRTYTQNSRMAISGHTRMATKRRECYSRKAQAPGS